MGEKEAIESGAHGVVCQAVSAWDEPCDMAAVEQCPQCSLWFCGPHISDSEWHPCLKGLAGLGVVRD